MPRPDPVRGGRKKRADAVAKMMAAMDECAMARGEANWTNGYRTASAGRADSLYEKEKAQWHHCDVAERKFRRLAQRLLREAPQ